MCSLTRVGQVKATARRGAEMEWSWLTPASCTRFSPPPSTRGRAQPLFPFALGCGDVADPSSGLLHRHQWRHFTLVLLVAAPHSVLDAPAFLHGPPPFPSWASPAVWWLYLLPQGPGVA